MREGVVKWLNGQVVKWEGLGAQRGWGCDGTRKTARFRIFCAAKWMVLDVSYTPCPVAAMQPPLITLPRKVRRASRSWEGGAGLGGGLRFRRC